MSYFDLGFAFIFIPIVVILFSLVPKKIKPVVLLTASYILFFMISNILVIFLLLSTLSIYLAGRRIKSINELREKELLDAKDDKKVIKEKYKKRKKRVLLLVILFNLSFLFVFKYLKFFTINLNSILDLFGVGKLRILKFAAPIGISYYTLMAISYIVDVYNEKIEADKNYVRLALYLSFFPQIMEGPIAKYSETAEQLHNAKKVTYKNFCFGYQRILYGFFKKFVIADRLNAVVKVVFNHYTTFGGLSIFLGIVSYTIMLYMEFSGTMDVVLGTGDIFGVSIPENFNQPFFSKNISEFWSRWHISLGHWFKDYIFYPVSLSKPLKKITSKLRPKLGAHYSSLIAGAIALFCVWFLNGLWHGAGWPFLMFGMYHFFMILMGNIFEPIIQKLCTKLNIDRSKKGYVVLQIIKTSFFVFIGEMFFRADTVGQGFGMLTRMFTRLFVLKPNEISRFSLDIKDLIVIIIGLIFVFIIGLLKEKKINVREEVASKHIAIRWALYYLLIFAIIIFGAYGPSYSPVDPIYADF